MHFSLRSIVLFGSIGEPIATHIRDDTDFDFTRFVSLGTYGIINMFLARRHYIPSVIIFISQYVAYGIYVVFKGVPSPVSLALGIARTPDLIHLFLLGLVAGSLSFGGAFTAIPFIQAEAVLLGSWLPQQVFIDCIAIVNIIPAPLVIFATFVGFQGGYVHAGLGYAFAGATVISLGMFFPCFLFTIAGHHLLEKLVRNKVRPVVYSWLALGVILKLLPFFSFWQLFSKGSAAPLSVSSLS
jgi:chromate transport protein ChrA